MSYLMIHKQCSTLHKVKVLFYHVPQDKY